MQFSISQLRQIIQEEFEAELQEKKKQQKGKKRAAKSAKRKNKKIKAAPHFSPSQSPAAADKTFHNCIVSVKSDKNLEPDPGTNKETAAARICTDSRKEGGASLDWGDKRRRDVEEKRPHGLTGKEKELPKLKSHKKSSRNNNDED
jgi:hypothetical protein